MARNVLTTVENNFVNGLITEATGLNFPENAVVDADNCTFDEIGRVKRRLGLDLETDATYQDVTDSDYVYNEFLWGNVNPKGDLSMHVQQIGPFLKFYSVNASSGLSSGFLSQINLEDYSSAGLTDISTNACQFTVGFGYLFVVHPVVDPIYVAYDDVAGTFSTGQITISTRDFVGSQDAVQTRKTTLSPQHFYDLNNQGWNSSQILNFHEQVGLYPSDFDVWWLYKNAAEEFVPGTLANTITRGNSLSPKGSFNLTEFYQDRANTTLPPQSPTELPVVSSNGQRPSCVGFFAGRVFYSGVSARGYSNKIYFSQIIERVAQFGECFQVNDPAAEISADLLATDGGVIAIADAGSILKLWSLEGSLLVFATNGIWQITGSTGIGFAATDYTVKRLSSIQTHSFYSFVDVNGSPVWWSNDNIYSVQVNPTTGAIGVQSLSDKKIKALLRLIPVEAKKYVKGAYNSENKLIQWVYRETSPVTVKEKHTYTNIMNLNTLTGAFFPWSLTSGGPATLKGITCLSGSGTAQVTSNVTTDSGSDVVDIFNSLVTVRQTSVTSLEALFKYVILHTANVRLTFAEERDTSYLDFQSLSGTDYSSYFTSGYKLRGEAQKKFQSNYVLFYTETQDPSTFLITGQWDFANSASTSRWTVPQRILMSGGEYSYNKKRVKLRGHGVALQYRVESETGKPFDLIGWSSFDTVNGTL